MSKKAVIRTGGKQYMVKEGQVLDVELLGPKVGDKVKLETLAIVDGDKSEFGTPLLKQQTEVEVVDADYQGTKVVSIRFKAKKRVDVKRGHRQRYTKIKVGKIA
jgi:large subunit ribosomal protein L21